MTPAFKQKAIADALTRFYQKPVAWISLELILSISLVILLAVFAIQPTLITMSNLTKEIQDKKELAKKLDQKIAALNTAQGIMTSLDDKLPSLEDAIPTQPRLLNVLKVLEKSATDTGVIITNISVPTIPDESQVDLSKGLTQVSFPVNVSITADYLSIRRYIESLKEYKRVFLIQNVTFTTQEDRGTRGLQATVSLTVPYFGSKK